MQTESHLLEISSTEIKQRTYYAFNTITSNKFRIQPGFSTEQPLILRRSHQNFTAMQHARRKITPTEQSGKGMVDIRVIEVV